MIDRDFGELKSGILHLSDHFYADHAAVIFQLNLIKNRHADQSEITIHISYLKTEQKVHNPMIRFSDNFSVEPVGPADFISIDNIYPVLHFWQKLCDFRDIILKISVCIKQKFFCCRRKTGLKRAAVTFVFFMINDFQAIIFLFQFTEYSPAVIRAAIIDHQDFVVFG